MHGHVDADADADADAEKAPPPSGTASAFTHGSRTSMGSQSDDEKACWQSRSSLDSAAEQGQPPR